MAKKTRKQTIITMNLNGKTTQQDILGGIQGYRDCNRCMEKVSIARALLNEHDAPPHATGVKIDAGHIRYRLDGYRWQATTPRIQSKSLIDFDAVIQKARRKKLPWPEIERLVLARIKEHEWKITAVRMSKITPLSRETMDRVNKARREAYANGKRPKQYSLNKRVVGFR
jgi:hypothetical protein